MLTKIIDNMHNMGLYLAYNFFLHIPTTIILDMVRGMQGLLSICYSKACLFDNVKVKNGPTSAVM